VNVFVKVPKPVFVPPVPVPVPVNVFVPPPVPVLLPVPVPLPVVHDPTATQANMLPPLPLGTLQHSWFEPHVVPPQACPVLLPLLPYELLPPSPLVKVLSLLPQPTAIPAPPPQRMTNAKSFVFMTSPVLRSTPAKHSATEEKELPAWPR
jgi:hypothetical protein